MVLFFSSLLLCYIFPCSYIVSKWSSLKLRNLWCYMEVFPQVLGYTLHQPPNLLWLYQTFCFHVLRIWHLPTSQFIPHISHKLNLSTPLQLVSATNLISYKCFPFSGRFSTIFSWSYCQTGNWFIEWREKHRQSCSCCFRSTTFLCLVSFR